MVFCFSALGQPSIPLRSFLLSEDKLLSVPPKDLLNGSYYSRSFFLLLNSWRCLGKKRPRTTTTTTRPGAAVAVYWTKCRLRKPSTQKRASRVSSPCTQPRLAQSETLPLLSSRGSWEKKQTANIQLTKKGVLPRIVTMMSAGRQRVSGPRVGSQEASPSLSVCFPCFDSNDSYLSQRRLLD